MSVFFPYAISLDFHFLVSDRDTLSEFIQVASVPSDFKVIKTRKWLTA